MTTGTGNLFECHLSTLSNSLNDFVNKGTFCPEEKVTIKLQSAPELIKHVRAWVLTSTCTLILLYQYDGNPAHSAFINSLINFSWSPFPTRLINWPSFRPTPAGPVGIQVRKMS